MGPRLIGIAAILARRQGAAAAQTLLRRGAAWLADPANEEAKRALVQQLRAAGGQAGRLGSGLAREIEKRRVSVGAWERDLMALRYDIADMAPGPLREAAFAAYLAQAGAGVHLIGSARRRERTRTEVIAALRAEERQLRTERLSADERSRAIARVGEALGACSATGVVAHPGPGA